MKNMRHPEMKSLTKYSSQVMGSSISTMGGAEGSAARSRGSSLNVSLGGGGIASEMTYSTHSVRVGKIMPVSQGVMKYQTRIGDIIMT